MNRVPSISDHGTFKCNRAHERKIWMYEDAGLIECDWNKFINEAENIDVAIY